MHVLPSGYWNKSEAYTWPDSGVYYIEHTENQHGPGGKVLGTENWSTDWLLKLDLY